MNRALVTRAATTLGVISLAVACSSASSTFVMDQPDATAGDGGGDSGGGSLADHNDSGPPHFGGSDASDAPPPIVSHVTGKVVAPEGTIPIPGAVVYLTSDKPDDLQNGLYCDHCVQLKQYTPYAITAPDGTFKIGVTQAGQQYVVTQKGPFRRIRRFNAPSSGSSVIPLEYTTLPGKTNVAEGDKTPNIAVIQGDYDPVEQALMKLGLEQAPGNFDILTGSSVVSSWAELSKYNFLFVPCQSDVMWIMSNPTIQDNVRQFVEKGGLIYNSDWANDFTIQTFPKPMQLVGEDLGMYCSACGNEYDIPKATILDKDLAEWAKNPDALGTDTPPIQGDWSRVAKLSTYATTDENGKPIMATPTGWVQGPEEKRDGVANTVSFPWGCGKAFFTTYHTDNSGFADAGPGLTAQEKLLMILVLHASVCLGSGDGSGVTIIK